MVAHQVLVLFVLVRIRIAQPSLADVSSTHPLFVVISDSHNSSVNSVRKKNSQLMTQRSLPKNCVNIFQAHTVPQHFPKSTKTRAKTYKNTSKRAFWIAQLRKNNYPTGHFPPANWIFKKNYAVKNFYNAKERSRIAINIVHCCKTYSSIQFRRSKLTILSPPKKLSCVILCETFFGGYLFFP